MRLYTHITHYEREVIQKMLYAPENFSIREIARRIGRSPSTVVRELKRNATYAYNAREATHKAYKRRKDAKQCSIERIPELRERILSLLNQYYSPEVIAYMLKQEGKYRCSHETIYQWIYKSIRSGKRTELGETLFFRRKKRQKRSNVYKNRLFEMGKKRIWQRPDKAQEKREIGHLEGDLIESKGKDAYLVTLVDRLSAYTWAIKVPSKDAQTVTRAIIEVLEEMPHFSIKTITFYNGKEFNHYKKIEEVLGCEVYFANPYAAYQRGLNEHINRQYRRYMPKNKSFAHLTDDDIRVIQDTINLKPRKSRNWKSPYELLQQHLNVALQT